MPPDYSGQNLRGRSFKGQDLSGTNFSKADIRGANFSKAILKGANFTGAKAGLQKRWTVGLLIVSWLLSAISGFVSVSISSLVLGLVYALIYYIISVWETEHFIATLGIVGLIITIFRIVTIRKGLTAGLKAVATSVVLAVAVVIVIARAFIFTITLAKILETVALIAGGAFAVLITVGIASTTGAIAGAIAGATVEAIAVAIAVVIAGAGAICVFIPSFPLTATALAFTLFSAYTGWRSLADEKESSTRSFVIVLAATGGTSFRNADLTDANFTGATLRNTDFIKANLTYTRFYEVKKLDLARVDETILAQQNVLNLLMSLNGRNKSYVGANLRGANLMGANLKAANLKDADISEATFQGACLEEANLAIDKAVNTDFTRAQMTGACVIAWKIASTTKLDNVDCRFIYLLEDAKPGTDDRERRPSSGEFKPGEFTKLFEEVLNTVDLIFRNGIDWKAFVTSFKKVQVENEDTDLSIQSIGNKGDGVVVVKLNVPDGTDKEKIHSDFMQNYQLALQAVEEKYKAQLQAKDNEIVIYRQQSADMKEIIGLLANKPINVQVDNKVEAKNMTNSNDYSRKFENSGTLNNSGQINLGEISGTVTNTINELPSASESEKPGIKELLTQLKAAIEVEKDLSEEDKAEALEQVQALAEAGKNPQAEPHQKAAKTAMKILKGTITGLPATATLVEAVSKLLPLISKFLGLG
ncbi:pentapeptide repeat-containing protein [Nostoc sp. CMAA1605]|uniref:pentapeptide repeat-containing protein n=1 Tax=Nostoc sp. CMAA1605 TaxID=2055159 RepID=UPI001F19162D|nr:pentapeptide repeat-containing protein [Nostoc sp. CMAA1605]MCF4970534.1 hypothetical protein [Nostoc sp. CMAA1605]